MFCVNEREQTIWQFIYMYNLTIYLHVTSILKKIDVGFSCVCPVVNNEFRRNIFKIALTMFIWRNSWSCSCVRWKPFHCFVPHCLRQKSYSFDAKKCMLGYLSVYIISSEKKTVVPQSCELWGTHDFQGQISEHIFCQMEAIVFI